MDLQFIILDGYSIILVAIVDTPETAIELEDGIILNSYGLHTMETIEKWPCHISLETIDCHHCLESGQIPFNECSFSVCKLKGSHSVKRKAQVILEMVIYIGSWDDGNESVHADHPGSDTTAESK
jgi:hypothetical protein